MAFEKGVSGNPKGRPKESSKQRAMRAQIQGAMPDVIEKLIESALNGDSMAAKLLLDKVLINAKPEAEKFTKGLTRGNLTPTETAKHVLNSMMNGLVTIEQGQAVMGTVANYCKIVESDELLVRIAALEGKENVT